MNKIDLAQLEREEERKKYTSSTYEEVTRNFIDEIMREFDFDKVQRVMTFLNWEWAIGNPSNLNVPSVSRIQSVARELLEESARKRGGRSTGGLAVTFREGLEDGFPWVSMGLSFEIENYDFDGEYYAQVN
jgi:hypothetical protein